MRILLIDDAALLREGSAGLLTTTGHEVVAQVTDVDALRTKVGRLVAAGGLPDVVVTGVCMSPIGMDDGLRAAIDLRQTYPGLPVVVLGAYMAGPCVQDLLEETESPTSPVGLEAPSASNGGAVGYLLKERAGWMAGFLHSLDIVMGGGAVIDLEVVPHLIKAVRVTGFTQEITQVATGCRTDEDVGAMVGAGSNAAPIALGVRGPVLVAVASSSTPSGGIVSAVLGGAGLDRLTRREQEALELMARGLSDVQIAG